jgi:hypothetical protein
MNSTNCRILDPFFPYDPSPPTLVHPLGVLFQTWPVLFTLVALCFVEYNSGVLPSKVNERVAVGASLTYSFLASLLTWRFAELLICDYPFDGAAPNYVWIFVGSVSSLVYSAIVLVTVSKYSKRASFFLCLLLAVASAFCDWSFRGNLFPLSPCVLPLAALQQVWCILSVSVLNSMRRRALISRERRCYPKSDSGLVGSVENGEKKKEERGTLPTGIFAYA